MNKFKDLVPEQFYKGNQHVTPGNVGQLIEQLERLPKDLLLTGTFSNEIELIVHSIDTSLPYLEIHDHEPE